MKAQPFFPIPGQPKGSSRYLWRNRRPKDFEVWQQMFSVPSLGNARNAIARPALVSSGKHSTIQNCGRRYEIFYTAVSDAWIYGWTDGHIFLCTCDEAILEEDPSDHLPYLLFSLRSPAPCPHAPSILSLTSLVSSGRQRGNLTNASTIASPFKFLESDDPFEAATTSSTNTLKHPPTVTNQNDSIDKQKLPDWLQFDFSKSKT